MIEESQNESGSVLVTFWRAFCAPSVAVFLCAVLISIIQINVILSLGDRLPRIIPIELLRRGLDDLVLNHINEIVDLHDTDIVIVLVGGSGCREAVNSGSVIDENFSRSIGQRVRFFNMSTSGQTYLLSLAIIAELSDRLPTIVLIQTGSSILGAGAWERDFHYPLPMAESRNLILGKPFAPSWQSFLSVQRLGPNLRTAHSRWVNNTPPLEKLVHFYQKAPGIDDEGAQKLRDRVQTDLIGHYWKKSELNFYMFERILQVGKKRDFILAFINQPLNPAIAPALGTVAADTRRGLERLANDYDIAAITCDAAAGLAAKDFVDMSHLTDEARVRFTSAFISHVSAIAKQMVR